MKYIFAIAGLVFLTTVSMSQVHIEGTTKSVQQLVDEGALVILSE